MRSHDGTLVLAPTDLGRFLSCNHLTALDLAVVQGLRKAPPIYDDPVIEVLRKRGFDHERGYTEKHAARGLRIVDISEGADRTARTLAAMREGADMIVQGKLKHDGWAGYPDVLRRVAVSSDLGNWSYEALDTKLAKETKGTTILQLSLYSELLATLQGVAPEFFHVVTPLQEETYRLDDFAAYYRLVKRRLLETVCVHPEELAALHYPEPVDHCELCRWDMQCKRRRRDDDHLSLVAGISRLQRRELESRDVKTLAALGRMPLPLDPKPARGAQESYERVREQARVQLEAREKNERVHELILPPKEGEGLARLPAPSKGDVFLDLEGARYVDDGGREYLFGLVTVGTRKKIEYRESWAMNAKEERAAFEAVVDLMIAALEKDPGMHVYHYTGYEPGAMKRLMGRYATREAEVDRLLRGERFVDLHTVVKQALRASVEKYSIKDLEPFYDFAREMDLRKAGDTRALLERCLEMDTPGTITTEDRTIVAAYNRDDCVSTLRLRDWLEEQRAALVASGTDISRPAPKKDEPSEKTEERDARIAALIGRLTSDVPDDRTERTPAQQARWLLAHMLNFHNREDKVSWWELFALRDMPEEDWLEEGKVITGMEFMERLSMGRARPTDRYRFPEQACLVEVGDSAYDEAGDLGVVEWVDRDERTVDILKHGKRAEDHPSSAHFHKFFNKEVLKDALERIATSVADDNIESPGAYQATCALLMREGPRIRGARFRRKPGEPVLDFAVRVGTRLDASVLAVQGPPGSGKTFTGAHMICNMVRNGLRVGVTANGHTVIRNLLDKVMETAGQLGVPVRCGARVSEPSPDSGDIEEFVGSPSNAHAIEAIRSGSIQVLGGTAWLWARKEAVDLVDVLVVDEAGQMKLPNVIAASSAANSLVLLGDPQQLDQPGRGSHPDGTDASALAHILQGEKVIAPDRGIFLAETWRMAPPICGFCSEVFYESKLAPRAGLEAQVLSGVAPFDGAGLWRVDVVHEGNTNESPEEVEAVARIVDVLLAKEARWTNAHGKAAAIKPADILVVSPYNLQVDAIESRLSPRGIRAGTVDKFQGQEAPVVIYSMASSSPSDASRGMEFIYSLNRLNVATSRARCATILVASPKLYEPECRSPRQMKLANGLCRYAEMARVVPV